MLQLVWLHCLHSVISAHADTLYLADTKFLFLDPLEQKRATTAGLIWVQLPPNWVEFVVDWFAMGMPRTYLFSWMDKIPTPAVFDSLIKWFAAHYI